MYFSTKGPYEFLYKYIQCLWPGSSSQTMISFLKFPLMLRLVSEEFNIFLQEETIPQKDSMAFAMVWKVFAPPN